MGPARREKEDELSGRKTIAAQVESYVAAATTSLERGALDDVRELLGRAIRLDPQDVATLRLQERLDDALAESARGWRTLSAGSARFARASPALIARANATSGHNDAIALLNEALGLDPEDAEVRQLLETRHREAHEVEAAERARREKEAEAAALVQAELERRARLDGQLAEAARHLARENLTKAIVITESVLRAEPDNAAARDAPCAGARRDRGKAAGRGTGSTGAREAASPGGHDCHGRGRGHTRLGDRDPRDSAA